MRQAVRRLWHWWKDRTVLYNMLDLPLTVPTDLDARGYLDPGQEVVVDKATARYLFTAGGYGNRLKERE